MKTDLTIKQAILWAGIWTDARELGLSLADSQKIADDLCRELPSLDSGPGCVDPVCPIVEVRNACGRVEINGTQ